VSGIAAIESLKPVRELARLAADAPGDLGAVRTAAEAVAYVAAPTPYAARLRAYVDRYGDRYLEELKLESPTFRTDPLLLIETIRTSAPERVEGSEPASVPELVEGPRLLRPLIRAATRAIAGREASRLDRARVYGMVRAIVRRAGVLLAEADRIDQPDDVFWLTLDELWASLAGADLRRTVADRKRRQASYALLPGFRRITFAGEPFDVAVPVARSEEGWSDDHPAVWTGVGVSSGTVTGPALVVHDPRLVGDVTGTVLVTTMTDPGWVFLLSRAAAVVAERGSLLSHTAIVARELGVPAVVGVADATRRIRTGQLLTVDGTTGEVSAHPVPAPVVGPLNARLNERESR
jgi:pyruvate,water dikinase